MRCLPYHRPQTPDCVVLCAFGEGRPAHSIGPRLEVTRYDGGGIFDEAQSVKRVWVRIPGLVVQDVVALYAGDLTGF